MVLPELKYELKGGLVVSEKLNQLSFSKVIGGSRRGWGTMDVKMCSKQQNS